MENSGSSFSFVYVQSVLESKIQSGSKKEKKSSKRIRWSIQKIKGSANSFAELDSLLQNIKKGNGSVGKLAFTNELKVQIDCTKTSWERLRDDLEADPKDFVGFSIFGLKAEGYQPNKNQKNQLDGMLDTLDSGKSVKYKK